MIHFRLFFSLLVLAVCVIILPVSCKTTEATVSTGSSTADTTATQQKNPIQSSGKVQGGTFNNGAGQDNSPTGSKPKQ